MYYMGIDIGKNNHEVGFIREDGSYMGKSLCFTNTQEGFEKLIQLIKDRLPQDETFCIGMEATGHYWLALYSFLHEQGNILHVIYPTAFESSTSINRSLMPNHPYGRDTNEAIRMRS